MQTSDSLPNFPVNFARSGMIDTHSKIRHSYDMISPSPNPPYYAVIFSSLRTEGDDGYESMAQKMLELAQKQPGFLGMESVRDQSGLGITISYWDSLQSVSIWKSHLEHREAQRLGREKWYRQFKVRICQVERDYAF